MRYEKLNIEITNEHYFNKIEELEFCIKLYSDDTLQFILYNNSKVVAYDKSTVCAYDSSTIFAYNNSIVEAKDNSLVSAYNSSKVYAYYKSIVCAYDNSKVDAVNNSKVYAHDRSIIYANYNSIVYAKDNSTIYANYNTTVYAKDKSIIYANGSSIIYAYDNSTAYAYDESTLYAYEFSYIHIKSHKATLNAINHFGAILKQVFKIKEDILVYKKLQDDKIATLKLVKGQTFQSEHFNKCRIDRAVVVEITNIENTEKYQNGVSIRNDNFIYEVGKEVIADKYDKNIEECSNGIHFFLTREKAEEYYEL